MSYDELLATLEKAAPELKGGLKVDRVIYKRASRHAYFYLLSENVAGEREYTAIRKALRAAFPGVRLSLRIASPSLQEDFLQNPDRYAHVINDILLRGKIRLTVRAFQICMVAMLVLMNATDFFSNIVSKGIDLVQNGVLTVIMRLFGLS